MGILCCLDYVYVVLIDSVDLLRYQMNEWPVRRELIVNIKAKSVVMVKKGKFIYLKKWLSHTY